MKAGLFQRITMGLAFVALAATAVVAVVVLATNEAPTPPTDIPTDVPTDVLTDVPSDRPVCALDRGQVTMKVRPDPGLGDPDLQPVVPALRSYMPARFTAMLCPKTDCQLPEPIGASVWSRSGEEWRDTKLELDYIPRGRCLELQLQSTAERVWPGAVPGVVRWAAVVGDPPTDGDPEVWLGVGRLVWLGDVVHAGLDGSPDVH